MTTETAKFASSNVAALPVTVVVVRGPNGNVITVEAVIGHNPDVEYVRRWIEARHRNMSLIHAHIELHGPFDLNEDTRIDDLHKYLVCYREGTENIDPLAPQHLYVDARNGTHAAAVGQREAALQLGYQPSDEDWQDCVNRVDIIAVVRLNPIT